MPDDERPPLRDRSWLFHHLLNGSRDEYVAPGWREQRRLARSAEQRRTAAPPEPAPRSPDLDDARRRSQRHEAERQEIAGEKKIGRSCLRLLWSARAARRRIRRATTGRARDEAALAAVSQDAKEIAKRLGKVRRRALRLHRQLGARSPFDHDEVLGLHLAGGDTDHKARKRTYQELTTRLEAYERHALDLRRGISARRRSFSRAERARRPAR